MKEKSGKNDIMEVNSSKNLLRTNYRIVFYLYNPSGRKILVLKKKYTQKKIQKLTWEYTISLEFMSRRCINPRERFCYQSLGNMEERTRISEV